MDLRRNSFSIIIDETTDKSRNHILCVIAKYYDRLLGVMKTKIIDLINVYGESGAIGETAEALYQRVLNTLTRLRIPHVNLIGFAADGCSTMMGDHNSVSSRIKRDFEGVIVYKCVCHSLHLAASWATKTLPRQLETLVRSIYAHFSLSPKRIHEFSELQVALDMDSHKILHPSQTRWLSMTNAIQRILEQWDALKIYFCSIEEEEKLESVSKIVKEMSDPSVLMYLQFLGYILPKVSELNKYFQSEKPLIHSLQFKIIKFYKLILNMFCDSSKINSSNLATFDPSQSFNQRNTIYLGPYVHELLLLDCYKSRPEMVKDVQRRCVVFMVRLCQEIRERFDFGDPLLHMISYLEPQTMLKHQTRELMPSLIPLVDRLPRVFEGDRRLLDDEWRYLDHVQLPSHLTQPDLGVVPFYQGLLAYTENNEPVFPTLATFSLQILSLPITNVDAERLFSKIKLMRTDTRNRLQTDTLLSLAVISEYAKEHGGCFNVQTTEEMINCNIGV